MMTALIEVWLLVHDFYSTTINRASFCKVLVGVVRVQPSFITFLVLVDVRILSLIALS
jgi:hypothetical protein